MLVWLHLQNSPRQIAAEGDRVPAARVDQAEAWDASEKPRHQQHPEWQGDPANQVSADQP